MVESTMLNDATPAAEGCRCMPTFMTGSHGLSFLGEDAQILLLAGEAEGT